MEQTKWALAHVYNLSCGFLAAFIGYFVPVVHIVTVMVIAIVIDLVIGVIAALKNGIGICSRKLWRTVYKLLFAIIVVTLMYAIDKEMGVIELHKFIAWLITGFEVWSILENAAKICNHPIFRILQKFMNGKVKAVTGIDLKESNNDV